MQSNSASDLQIQELHKPKLKPRPLLCIGLRLAHGLHSSLYFEQSPIVIGRSESCDLQLPYPWVSLQHVEVHWSETGVCARDLYAKVPARLQQHALSSALSEPQQELRLHLPSISLHCSLSAYPSASSYTQEQLLRRLWRPESGWIIWSQNPVDEQSTIRLNWQDSSRYAHEAREQNAGNEKDLSSKDKPVSNSSHNELKTIRSQPWSASLGIDQNHLAERGRSQGFTPNDLQGQCWLILGLGQYQIDVGNHKAALYLEQTKLKLNHHLSNSKEVRLYSIEDHLYRLDLGKHSVFINKSANIPSQLISKGKPKDFGGKLYSFLRDRLKDMTLLLQAKR